MKVLRWVLLVLPSMILMGYGWYLGQLHSSGYDLAGIFLFVTGMAGLVLALAFRFFGRKLGWWKRWYANLLTGILSCGVVSWLVIIIARFIG
jgi:hypothetical protein